MVSTFSSRPESKLSISRKSYARLPQILEVPNLIAIQLDSFRWFQEKGLMELLKEVSPVTDLIGNRLELKFIEDTTCICSLLGIGEVRCDECGKIIRHEDRYCYRTAQDKNSDRDKRYCVDCSLDAGYLRMIRDKKTGEVYPAMFVLKDEDTVSGDTEAVIDARQPSIYQCYEFRKPRHTELECRQRDLTYSVPLYVKSRLLVKATGEIKEEDIFFGDIPLMTANGTFTTSGAERVVVSQLLRSPGVYFTAEMPLNFGSNNFEVLVFDKAGNSNHDKVIVHRQDINPPIITIRSPENYEVTSLSSINVSGTVLTARDDQHERDHRRETCTPLSNRNLTT